MVLLTVAGWAASKYLGLKSGTFIGLLVGMVVANFVPSNSACGVKSPPPQHAPDVNPDRPE